MTSIATAAQVVYSGSIEYLHGRTYTVTHVNGNGTLVLTDTEGCFCAGQRTWFGPSCRQCGNHLVNVRQASVTPV